MIDWKHHWADINGLRMHWVEQGTGPLYILAHGFPHTWFTWRHQIPALAEAGFRVVAPDMRGMGETFGPPEVEAYSGQHVVDDLIGLMDHLGEEKALFSGLDFGGYATYDVGYLHPERVQGLIGIQNAFSPMVKTFKSSAAAQRGEHFDHMTYLMTPGRSDDDLNSRPRAALKGIFHVLSEIGDFTKVWKHPTDAHYVDAIGEVPDLPWSWLSEWELEHYVEAWSRSGFTTGLNWYRARNHTAEFRKEFISGPNPAPFWFVYSKGDIDMQVFQGDDPHERLSERYADLREVRVLEKGGHMLPMERPDELNRVLIDFARQATVS